MAQIDEIVDGIYRISTWEPNGSAITFNQFLIDDEHPTLVHTGLHQHYDGVVSAISQVLDPERLRYVVLLHFEADECGGMDRFLEGAPHAALVCSKLSADLNLRGWPYRGRVEARGDGDVVALGRKTLRILETPHVHHWDSMMLFEESTGSLFPSDLFTQTGPQPPIVTDDLGSEMCAFYRETGIFAHEEPVLGAVERIEQLDPSWTHPMHGGSLAGPTLRHFTAALRREPFAYEGSLLGRRVPFRSRAR